MDIICTILRIYVFVILVRIVLSWFPISRDSPMEGVASVLWAVTEPVMAPVRAALPPVRLGGMALDLSPIVVILGLQILIAFIC
ncbi:MAG: YggT family protein [Acidimicrobiales bacterium]